jgi:hypothetical protein
VALDDVVWTKSNKTKGIFKTCVAKMRKARVKYVLKVTIRNHDDLDLRDGSRPRTLHGPQRDRHKRRAYRRAFPALHPGGRLPDARHSRPQSCAAVVRRMRVRPGLACVARLARLAAGGHVVSGPAVKKGPEVRAPASRRARTSAPRRRSTPLRPVYPLRFAMSLRSFSSISGFDSAILRSSSRWYSRFSAWRLF